jgi:hypothetical protein
MSTRIQVVLENQEKAAFKAAASRAGMSLSAWIKGCATQALAARRNRDIPRTREALRAFFEACDAVEEGVEPDWQEHCRVIEESFASGGTGS